MITITRDEAVRSDKSFHNQYMLCNSKLLHGQTQNDEMQEIQTEATIAMFRDTETIQNNPTTQQTKIYQAIENRRDS